MCARDQAKPPETPLKSRLEFGPHTANHAPLEVIQRPVQARLHCLRRCYEEGVARNPALAGRVVIRFVIEEGTETPKLVTLDDSDLLDDAVVSCLVNEFKALRFPKPQGGNVTVIYPLTLTPE